MVKYAVFVLVTFELVVSCPCCRRNLCETTPRVRIVCCQNFTVLEFDVFFKNKEFFLITTVFISHVLFVHSLAFEM